MSKVVGPLQILRSLHVFFAGSAAKHGSGSGLDGTRLLHVYCCCFHLWSSYVILSIGHQPASRHSSWPLHSFEFHGSTNECFFCVHKLIFLKYEAVKYEAVLRMVSDDIFSAFHIFGLCCHSFGFLVHRLNNHCRWLKSPHGAILPLSECQIFDVLQEKAVLKSVMLSDI